MSSPTAIPLCNVCNFHHLSASHCSGPPSVGLVEPTTVFLPQTGELSVPWPEISLMNFQVLSYDQPLCSVCRSGHDPALECHGLIPVPPSPRCLHCEICHFTDECPPPCTSPLPCLLKPYSTEKWVCEDCARKNRTSPTDHFLHSGSRKSYFIPRCPTANTNG